MADLTRQLAGKAVAAVWTNGHILSIRMHDGAEINVAWVDDNGKPLKGRPLIETRGWRMRANAREIVSGREAGVFIPKI